MGVVIRRNIILVVSVIALALYLLIFGRGLDNYFVGDDWAFLDEVSRVHTFSEAAAFFSFGTTMLVRPLQKVLTWVLYSGFGLNFVVFHGLSLLLDLGNAVLMGVLAFLLFKSEKQADSHRLFWAIAVSILFAFHWTHHEAVFWYSAINEPLTAFCRLLALVLFVRVLPRRDAPAWLIGAVIVALVVLALFAKESAIVFPVELLLFFFYFRVSLPTGRIRPADLVVLGLVVLVVLGWLVLYWLGAPAGVIESGRGGVRLTLGSGRDWLTRIPLVFNGTILGLDRLSSQNRVWVELMLGIVFVGLAFYRRRFVWLLALVWTIVLMLPYALLLSAPEMMAYLSFSGLPLPDRYFYIITAGSSLFLVASIRWLWYEIDTYIPNRLLGRGVQALVGVALVILLALNMQKLVRAENDWNISGQTVLRLVQQLEPVVSNLQDSDTLCLANLPDNYNGKWTFRNATWGVLYLTFKRSDYDIAPGMDTDPPILNEHCTVHQIYDQTTGKFLPQ